ncbi:MAG: phosphoribosylamine--glycine ligase [Deltaproteobacteria bacterium]|nr:phosphoribosylamine--glycine ligase [Deltaproteobacteria bacterium]
MKVLVVGGGGREHAIVWKIKQSPLVEHIYCAPGNAGIAQLAECIEIDAADIDGLKTFAQQNNVSLTIVGPELPLTLGIVDQFNAAGLRVFGPNKEAAQLEGSKAFAKKMMKLAGIPTADHGEFTDAASAKKYISEINAPLVIKADGLAAGKGVFPCRTVAEAHAAVDRIMGQKEFGDAGDILIVEEFLEGEEASFICFTDGTTVLPLPSSQDHKPVFDGDQGPNTGGMGAYSPAPVITDELHNNVMRDVMEPLVKTLSEQGITFKGIIYAGLMIKDNIPRILEFNVRFGDPEAQPIFFRLESDLIELINAVIDERLADVTITCSSQPTVCIVMAAGGYPESYKKGFIISGLNEAGADPQTTVFHAGTAQRDGAVVTSGGRVLGVTSRGATVAEAIKTAYRAAGKITWDGVHYRKDIAQKALNR